MKLRMALAAAAGAVPLAGALACTGDGAASAGVVATTDTVAGVERLSYPEDAPRLAWSFDTVAVLGGFGVDDPKYQFGGVNGHGMASDSAGNLYIFDGNGLRVLGFTPSGEFLGEWGREGGGPGELAGGVFRSGGTTMAMGPGDTLWITDLQNQRFTLIPVAGGEPASIPLGDAPARIGGPVAVTERGAVAELSTFSFVPGEDAVFPPRPLVRIARDGTSGDTIWTAPAPERDLAEITTGNRRIMMMTTQSFSPGFNWVQFSDGGFAVQDTAEYVIHFVDTDGALVRHIRRAPAARATTEADRQRVIDEILEPPENGSLRDNPDLREQMAENTTFAEIIPRIRALRRDTRDRLWVGVSDDIPDEVGHIDVYERDGRLLGELHDAPMPNFFFGDGYAVLVGRDELDVETLTIVRVRTG